MAQEVGTVYVQVIPSGKDFGRSIEGSISQSVAKASKAGSGSLVTKFTGAFSKVGKIGLGAITTIGGGLAALAAKGGFQRALNIENARAKLAGLGHDAASVNKIMNNALESVKGTAFGLGDAASVAAMLSAAGVESGDKLTKTLKTVADTAQISGRSLTDIGTIFGSVAARGKLQGDDMLQLMSSGVPVLQLLAKHLGKTSEEVSKMVSKGQIDFQTFADAMNEGMGGAALKAGDTFQGALANMKAALGRMGESFQTPAMDSLRKVFNAAIPVLDQFTNKMKPLVDQWTGKLNPAVDGAVKLLTDFGVKLESGKIGLDDIAKSVGNLAGGFALLASLGKAPQILQVFDSLGSVGQSGFAKLAKQLDVIPKKVFATASTTKKSVQELKLIFSSDMRDALDLSNPIERVSAGLQDLGTAIGKPFAALGAKISGSNIGQKISGITSTVTGKFGKLTGAVTSQTQLFNTKISGVFSGLGSKIGDSKIGTMFTGLTSKIKTTAAPALNAVGNIFGGLGDMVAPQLQSGLGKIGGIFTSFFNPASFMKFLGIGGVAAALVLGLGMINQSTAGQVSQIITTTLSQLPALLAQAQVWLSTQLPVLMAQGAQLLTAIMQGITANAPMIMSTAVGIITWLVNGLSVQLPTLIPAALNMVLALVGGLLSNLGEIVNAGMNLLLGLVQGIMNALPQLIAQAPTIIGNMASSIAANLPQILATGVQILVTLATGLASAIPQLLSQIPAIIRGIWDAFTSVNWGEVGLNIITGIGKGIANAVGKLVDSAVNAAKDALNAVKGWLGIKSPSRRARDEIGKWIPAGMAVGINATSNQVTDASMQIADQALSPLRKLPQQYQNLLNDATKHLTVGQLKQDLNLGLTTSQYKVDDYRNNTQMAETLTRIEQLLASQEQQIVLDGRELGRAVQRYAIA